MPRNKEPVTRKRCPPKPGIEPIHLDELLGGAGMSGFLGVLDPPAIMPHLAGAFADLALAQQGKELAAWFCNRAEALVDGLGRQQESLFSVTEVARHMRGSAERLALLTKHFGERTKRQWQMTSERTELASGAV